MPTFDPDRRPADPAAPAIPSFESLRGPRRRSPIDVLLPGEPPVPPAPARPEPPAPPEASARPAAPRPPEWSDLLRLGMHVTGVVVAAPLRLVRRLLAG